MAQSRPGQPGQQQKKKGEIPELQEALSNPKVESKREAIRKIIDAMTRGKDVSMLFPDIVKNMESSNMEFKKLIYLYIINYAKIQPDLTILAINSFRKDAVDKTNPFLRALAVRTMGCIRVKQITEYLLEPLKKAMVDEDSYVRKTAAICIAKLYDTAPDLIEEQGMLKYLEKLIQGEEGNAMVVSNAIISHMMICEQKGEQMNLLTPSIVKKLLIAMGECNEWGCIYILDALAIYSPEEARETEMILERISPRLNHTNPGVVLSATRVMMKYLDYLTNAETIRSYCRKLTAPLISLLSGEPEIIYVALKNINLIIQKRPMVIDRELKVFFCNFNDPIYIKLQKLEILIRLANMDNIHQLLHELREYTTEVDVQFVRQSVKAIGRCAIKLEKAAEKCIYVLWECLKTKVNYVVYETIIAIRDIFRKYPRKYELIIKDICENQKLDDPDAKASMIWIIGEYTDTIQNADQILANFAETFKEEQPVVQHAILLACIKLFLMRPDDGFQIIQNLLKQATQECENPDLRDRGLNITDNFHLFKMHIYWRLLQKDPELTKKIVFADRPTISDNSYTMESEMLDKLLENIGTLSAVIYKPPELFVKRLRDILNQREQEDNEELNQAEDLLTESQQQPKEDDYADVPVQQNLPDEQSYQQNQIEQNYDNNMQQSTVSQDIDLLDMGDEQVSSSQYQSTTSTTSVQNSQVGYNNQNQGQNNIQQQQPQVQQVQCQPDPGTQNIRIPFSEVLNDQSYSVNQKVNGLQLEGVFQREGPKMYLYMKATNKSPNMDFTTFTIKFNANAFRLNPVSQNMDNLQLKPISPGHSSQTKIEVDTNGQSDNQPPQPIFKVQCALKTDYDVFIFVIPCSLTVLIQEPIQVSQEQYLEFGSKYPKKQENIPGVNISSDEIKRRFQQNGFYLVNVKTNPQGVEMLSYCAKCINGMPLLTDAIIDTQNNQVNLQLSAPHPSMLPLLKQAVGFILKI